MRKRLFRENTQFFHINIDFLCSPFFKELDWVFVQKKINPLLIQYGLQLYALVMMDTHIHLLVQSDCKQENYFCEELAYQFKKEQDHPEWHCEPILNYPQFLNAYKYIYRNPVEAGLVENVEDYLYSTLQTLLGKNAAHCAIVDHMGLVQNPFHHLNWLNNKDLFKFSQLKDFNSDTLLT